MLFHVQLIFYGLSMVVAHFGTRHVVSCPIFVTIRLEVDNYESKFIILSHLKKYNTGVNTILNIGVNTTLNTRVNT